MRDRQTEESKKRAADIASGNAKEEFFRQKKAQESREAFNKEAKGKPPDVKKEFNKQKDFRVSRYMTQQQEKERDAVNDNKQKDSALNKEFTAFHDMKKQREQAGNDNQKKDTGAKKEFNAFRKMKEERQRDKGRGRFANKEKPIGREI